MSRNQEVKKGTVPLTITPNDPLGKFLLPIDSASSDGLEVLVSVAVWWFKREWFTIGSEI